MTLKRFSPGISFTPPHLLVPIGCLKGLDFTHMRCAEGTDFEGAFGELINVATSRKTGGGRFFIFLDDADRAALKGVRERETEGAAMWHDLTGIQHDAEIKALYESDEFWLAQDHNDRYRETFEPGSQDISVGGNHMIMDGGIKVCLIRDGETKVTAFCIDVYVPAGGDAEIFMCHSKINR